jgi:hypothetical protein
LRRVTRSQTENLSLLSSRKPYSSQATLPTNDWGFDSECMDTDSIDEEFFLHTPKVGNKKSQFCTNKPDEHLSEREDEDEADSPKTSVNHSIFSPDNSQSALEKKKSSFYIRRSKENVSSFDQNLSLLQRLIKSPNLSNKCSTREKREKKKEEKVKQFEEEGLGWRSANLKKRSSNRLVPLKLIARKLGTPKILEARRRKLREEDRRLDIYALKHRHRQIRNPLSFTPLINTVNVRPVEQVHQKRMEAIKNFRAAQLNPQKNYSPTPSSKPALSLSQVKTHWKSSFKVMNALKEATFDQMSRNSNDSRDSKSTSPPKIVNDFTPEKQVTVKPVSNAGNNTKKKETIMDKLLKTNIHKIGEDKLKKNINQYSGSSPKSFVPPNPTPPLSPPQQPQQNNYDHENYDFKDANVSIKNHSTSDKNLSEKTKPIIHTQTKSMSNLSFNFENRVIKKKRVIIFL